MILENFIYLAGTDGSLILKFFQIPKTGKYCKNPIPAPYWLEPSENPAKKYAKEMRSTNIQVVFCCCAEICHVVTEEKKGAVNPTKDLKK
jgi:hypothetical protein